MPIENDQELEAAIERAGTELQAIQDYVRRDFTRQCKIRFPRGYIRTAAHFRARFWFVADETFQRNLGYAFILNDVLHWLLVRTDLGGTAKEMLIKDGVVLIGNIAETLTKLPLTGVTARRLNYKQRTNRLETMGVIDAGLRTELNWLWDTRCNCHYFLVTMREYGHYTVADYNRAVLTIRAFRDALEVYFT